MHCQIVRNIAVEDGHCLSGDNDNDNDNDYDDDGMNDNVVKSARNSKRCVTRLVHCLTRDKTRPLIMLKK